MQLPDQEKAVPLAQLNPVWPPPRDPYPWEIGRGKVWLTGLALFVFFGFLVPAFFRWPHAISSWGGRYFIQRTVIPVPAFQQNDPHWSEQLLGDTIDTLGQSGCAVTSAAMVLRAYGVDTDPQRLNAYLTTHRGYVGDGWLVWEKAAELGGGQVVKAYEDLPSYALIDANILKGNPVIVRIHLRNGTTHFVVVVGKQGWSYLIRDPARPPDYGVYPLHELVGRIEALRFYTIVPPPPRLPPVQVAVAPIPPKPSAPIIVAPPAPITGTQPVNPAPVAPPPILVPAPAAPKPIAAP
jgi:hypothetical protein